MAKKTWLDRGCGDECRIYQMREKSGRSEQVKGILIERSVLTVNTFLFIIHRGCCAVKLFEEYNQ